jgi:hypothetical protein
MRIDRLEADFISFFTLLISSETANLFPLVELFIQTIGCPCKPTFLCVERCVLGFTAGLTRECLAVEFFAIPD